MRSTRWSGRMDQKRSATVGKDGLVIEITSTPFTLVLTAPRKHRRPPVAACCCSSSTAEARDPPRQQRRRLEVHRRFVGKKRRKAFPISLERAGLFRTLSLSKESSKKKMRKFFLRSLFLSSRVFRHSLFFFPAPLLLAKKKKRHSNKKARSCFFFTTLSFFSPPLFCLFSPSRSR